MLNEKPLNGQQDQENELIPLLLKRQAELNSLLEITQAINKNSPSSVLFEMTEMILKGHLNIGKMRLLMKEEDHFYCAARYGGELETSKTLARISHLLEGHTEIRSLKADTNSLLNKYDYFVPVLQEDTTIACVLLGNFETETELLNSDLNFVQTLVNMIVVALENKKLFKERVHRERLQRDIELAGEVQNMLVPLSLPKTGVLEAGAVYMPNQNIGGDYYDFMPLNAREYIWCIGDVSGKGISAALLMANLQASMRAWVSVEKDLKKVVAKLNEVLLLNTNGERFVTLFLAIYNPETRQLRYINAGHIAPLLLREGKIVTLRSGTTVLGVFEELPFVHLGETYLQPGDIIFNYTDGLTESQNEEVYVKDEDIYRELKKHAALPIDNLNKKVLHGLQSRYKARLNSDDITILSFRVL